MKICALASGSEGNAALVWTDTTRILVDCGLSVKQLGVRLGSIGEHLDNIDAVCITHAHGDHVAGLPRTLKAAIKRGRELPAYLTHATGEAIDWDGLERPPLKYFEAGKSFVIGDIQVGSFTTPHDCNDPVGFTFRDGKSKIGYATDLGFIPPAMIARFRDCQAIMIESNYDEAMLDACDRPDAVKERTRGRMGHLDNKDVLEYLDMELSPGVRTVVLGHLSQVCNSPAIVNQLAAKALFKRDGFSDLCWIIASQDKPTPAVEV